MAKKKKKVPGLNSSSTADISFILLIFFLITTSMDTDMGLSRRLPRPPEENQEDATMDIKSRNLLCVRLNAAGQVWVKDEMKSDYEDLANLRQRVKDIDLLGQCFVTDKHVISVQTDRGTPYSVYFEVQNELVAAYNELRNELSKQKFGRPYDALSDEQKVAVRAYYPQNISEAEPKKYGGQ